MNKNKETPILFPVKHNDELYEDYERYLSNLIELRKKAGQEIKVVALELPRDFAEKEIEHNEISPNFFNKLHKFFASKGIRVIGIDSRIARDRSSIYTLANLIKKFGIGHWEVQMAKHVDKLNYGNEKAEHIFNKAMTLSKLPLETYNYKIINIAKLRSNFMASQIKKHPEIDLAVIGGMHATDIRQSHGLRVIKISKSLRKKIERNMAGIPISPKKLRRAANILHGRTIQARQDNKIIRGRIKRPTIK